MGPKTNSGDLKTIIKETIKELLTDENFVNLILKKVTEKVDNLEKDLTKKTQIIEQLEVKIDSMEQNEKMNNICLYGLYEEEKEKLNEKVLKLCNENLSVPVKKEDIIRCHRIGNNTNKPRPVVVKFEMYSTKFKILKNCGNLSGTKMGIAEDLTKNRMVLLKEARRLFDKKAVFTRQGNIFIKVDNNVTKKIRSSHDLNLLLIK